MDDFKVTLTIRNGDLDIECNNPRASAETIISVLARAERFLERRETVQELARALEESQLRRMFTAGA